MFLIIKPIDIPIGSIEKLLTLLFISLIIFMTLPSGGACAACKYQRRRCAPDCPLAPYFPADQPKTFHNVHRLFGVRSIVKILENLNESQKSEAMTSIIFQSHIRERDPVHGCLGVIQQLQYMICLFQEELRAVNTQLHFYRNQETNSSHIDLGMGLNINTDNVTSSFFSPPADLIHNPFPYHNNGFNEIKNNNGVIALESHLDMLSNQKEDVHAHGYDEIKDFLEMINDSKDT